MESKKVKLEISRIALVFIVLFGLCLLVWSFIIGVWVGSKISHKEETKIALENATPQVPPPPPPPLVSGYVPAQNITSQNQTFQVVQANQTLSNQTIGNQTPVVRVTNQTQVQPKPVPLSPPPKEKPKTEITSKQKEVAKLSSEIKKEEKLYALQVGAFSSKESAENLKTLAEKKGYKVSIRTVSSENKTLYKVYVGRYSDRVEAEKHISKVANDLGVSNPFVVELK